VNYLQFLGNYLTKIRTINVMEWINKELKRRSKVLGPSTEGRSIEIDILNTHWYNWRLDSRKILGNMYNNNKTVLKKRKLDSIEHILQKIMYVARLLFLHIFSDFFLLWILFQRAYEKLLYSILLFIAYKSTKIYLDR